MTGNAGDDWDPHIGIPGFIFIAMTTFVTMIVIIAIICGRAFHDVFTSPRTLIMCAVVSVIGSAAFYWKDRKWRR